MSSSIPSKSKSKEDDTEKAIPQNARSVSYQSLPSLDPKNANLGTILLFYQYVEPQWTKAEHKAALKKVIEIGAKCRITGRGRVAQEGLNCTLTGRPQDIRSFCTSLREWKEVFLETDFKLTDGVPLNKMFKSFSIRKANELVAYGLAGDKAPSLKKFAGTHLEADEYHMAMQDPNTVIIDVRNAYESAIGAFQPPKGGAKLIDPKMRNSVEFPKWLNSKGTQDELHGKKVLMYCTGGIRCERATALLNQMSTVNENLKPQGVFHCRGGIERYVKTYPGGGYWKGKNYLFDRRMEQTPDIKDAHTVENDIDSKCCLCRVKCTVYRGQFKCNRSLCRVPVIVCETCSHHATVRPENLVCELCRKGIKSPTGMPDLVSMKRKADALVPDSDCTLDKPDKDGLAYKRKVYYDNRVFLRRVPLTATFQKVKDVLGPEHISALEWLSDKDSGGFYGSCIVLLASPSCKRQLCDSNNGGGKVFMIDNKKIKITEVFKKDDEDLFDQFIQKEFPPIGQ